MQAAHCHLPRGSPPPTPWVPLPHKPCELHAPGLVAALLPMCSLHTRKRVTWARRGLREDSKLCSGPRCGLGRQAHTR